MTIVVHQNPQRRDRRREIVFAVLIGANECCREFDDAVIGTPVGELAYALALGAIERAHAVDPWASGASPASTWGPS